MPFANKQHLFCCATQKGGLLMHDIRTRKNLLCEEQMFANARGAVSSMVLGYEPYQLTIGTLGGYVMVYDIRYNLTSAVYKHHMGYPILSLATCKPKDSASRTLVSSGGPIFEMSLLNLENGAVDVLFRCNDSKSQTDLSLRKNDLFTVPEYHRESTFRDNYVGTLRRESCFHQFNRSLMSVRSHRQFEKLINQTAIGIKNIDQ